MWSRRSLLQGSAALAGGLWAGSARAATDEPPISERDFQASPVDKPLARSAGYDEERPFLFEGLEPRYATRVVRSCFIGMRDGVRLSTDFHIPVGARLPLPVILSRTPYDKRMTWKALQKLFPEQGFVYAIQDVRGRHESEGEFMAGSGLDREDGYDTVSWIAAQPWCNGSVGAIGSSYVGETAAKLSAMRHPAHKASIIMFDGSYAGGKERNGAFLQNGITLLRDSFEWFRLAVPKISYGPPAWVDRQRWFRSPASQTYSTQPVKPPEVDLDKHLKTLPAHSVLDRIGAAPNDFSDWMMHAAEPDHTYWRSQRFLTEADRFDVPALHVTGPQEQGGSGPYNFRLFRENAASKRARDNQVLLFTPAPHSRHAQASADTKFGARHFGDTRYPYYRTFIDWFGHWLRDDANQVETWPKVTMFVGGRNRWESTDSFPPRDMKPVRLYLRSGGRAATSESDGRLTSAPPRGREPADRYRYDPMDPTPSEPPAASKAEFGSGYFDRSSLEARPDLLVYTTAPLKEDLELAGPVQAVLNVSSSAKDTDFFAMLVEVDRQGRAINVTHGAARMRFREGLGRSRLMEPGRVYPVTIDMWFALLRIPAGNRIRLHVSSAHFPHFDRNLNTGGDIGTETRWVVADNQVHHSASQPSYLVLPVRGSTRLEI